MEGLSPFDRANAHPGSLAAAFRHGAGPGAQARERETLGRHLDGIAAHSKQENWSGATVWAAEAPLRLLGERINPTERIDRAGTRLGDSKYASHDYRKALDQAKITCSMSRRGNCWDNAVVESFFGTLKSELFQDVPLQSRDATGRAITEYIEDFYNVRRRHSSLNYQSPLEFELQQEARRRGGSAPVPLVLIEASRPSDTACHALGASQGSQGLIRSQRHRSQVVSERLGHGTVAFTLDRYAHALPGATAAHRSGASSFGRSIFKSQFPASWICPSRRMESARSVNRSRPGVKTLTHMRSWYGGPDIPRAKAKECPDGS